MEIFGGGNVLEYGPEEEGPHAIGEPYYWQESVVLVWWDTNNHVGGMHRIGHEPQQGENGGQISLWNHIFTKDRVFKRDCILPLRDEDRPANGFRGGDDGCSFEYTDHAIWRINEPEVQAELHITDAHTPVDIYPKSNSLGEDFAPNHMEVGGTVKGHLKVADKEYQIDGLAFRDHGWGIRQWDTLISHRWVAGTFGPDYSFLITCFHTSDDDLGAFGCIMRDGKLYYTKEVDVVTYFDLDGISHKGGRVSMTLSNDEKVELECTPMQKGVVSWIHGIACVDTMCEVKSGDRVGICDFEITNNHMRGSYQPKVARMAVIENGLHQTSV